MNVLIGNDDGIQSPGLHALFHALEKSGHKVLAVAPVHQQSGKGHSLTVFEPLRARNYKEGNFHGIGIYGTPTDCVKLGLGIMSGEKPYLVISGINDGQNVGPDIFYSGTIGAAAEGAHAGIPSIAVSHAGQPDREDFMAAAEHLVTLLDKIDWQKTASGRVININYPACGVKKSRGVRLCPQSPAVWKNIYNERLDPRGEKYWWLEGDIEEDRTLPTDRNLLREGFITVTPLKFDYTDYENLERLKQSGHSLE